MTPPTERPGRRASGVARLRTLADEAERALAGHGLALHDLGVLAPEDPAAARFLTAVERGFYETPPTGDHLAQVLAGQHADGRRRLGVWEAGDDPAESAPVGTFEDFVQPLTTWPGRTVYAALISDVTVSPGHRRRGALRAMMLRSLADAAEAGLPAAALTASEAGIYGRFGFGVATRWRQVHVDVAGEPALQGPRPGGRVRREEPRAIGTLVDELYQRVRLLHPGTVQRTASYLPAWEDRSLGEGDGKGSGLYAAVHRDDDGTPQGVALYRFAGWDAEPVTVKVTAFLPATPDARRGLVEHLVHLDLVRRLDWQRAPAAGRLEALFEDERRVRTQRAGDDLHLRLLDLPAAVAGRGWTVDGQVVLDVVDLLGPADGRWRVTVRDGVGEAEPVGEGEAAAELRLDVARLSGLWLGGSGAAAAADLAATGLVVEHVPGAAERLDTLLRPVSAPHSLTGF